MKNRLILVVLVLLAIASNGAENQEQGLLPGLDRCYTYYDSICKRLDSGYALPAATGNDYAKLWSNCFNYRDRQRARNIAIRITHESRFWSMLFEKLAGGTLDARKVLLSMRSVDVPSNQYALILPMLFTPDDMRSYSNELLGQIAGYSDQELTNVSLPCHPSEESNKRSQAFPSSTRGFGEKDFRTMRPFRNRILLDDLRSGCLPALTWAAFVSCHYDDAMAGYQRMKQLITALPPSDRSAGSIGFNFATYAYLAGKTVEPGDKYGWILADGVNLPASNIIAPGVANESYAEENAKLLKMSGERKVLGLTGCGQSKPVGAH